MFACLVDFYNFTPGEQQLKHLMIYYWSRIGIVFERETFEILSEYLLFIEIKASGIYKETFILLEFLY